VGGDERERLTLELLLILLGRPVHQREYDRKWEETATGGLRELVEWLTRDYERLLDESAARRGDPRPDPADKGALNAWREKHRGLTNVYAVDGFEAGARAVCRRVPEALLGSLRPASGAPQPVGTSDLESGVE
jgi:hypothetical protein